MNTKTKTAYAVQISKPEVRPIVVAYSEKECLPISVPGETRVNLKANVMKNYDRVVMLKDTRIYNKVMRHCVV